MKHFLNQDAAMDAGFYDASHFAAYLEERQEYPSKDTALIKVNIVQFLLPE